MDFENKFLNLKPRLELFDNYVKNSLDRPIYRFIRFEHFLSMLINKKKWISQTTLWDDVYENFLGKVTFNYGKVPLSNRGYIYNFYGESWTMQNENDALWRIYSNDKKSIRIKSSIRKVIGCCTNEFDVNTESITYCTIGRVKYLTSNKINEWIKSFQNPILGSNVLLESLFIKRKEFEHEKEVRLIVHKKSDQSEESKGILRNHLLLKINLNEVVDEITFDPRLTNEEYFIFKNVIEKLGFKNKIKKSKLYDLDLPEINIQNFSN